MGSFYSRLFHAGSIHRDRLEDFLTEALADLLNRLPAAEVRRFCTNFLFQDAGIQLKKSWIAAYCDVQAFICETQEWISSEKRPDIILYQENSRDKKTATAEPFERRRSLLIIECKIGAPFTENQLHHYDDWISQKGDRCQGLVLLTHLTNAPSDFLDRKSEYKSPARAVRRWSELYQWLDREANWSECAPEAHFLKGELLAFMKEKALMTEEPTLQDLAAARLLSCRRSAPADK
jgi:hypothetical protein